MVNANTRLAFLFCAAAAATRAMPLGCSGAAARVPTIQESGIEESIQKSTLQKNRESLESFLKEPVHSDACFSSIR